MCAGISFRENSLIIKDPNFSFNNILYFFILYFFYTSLNTCFLLFLRFFLLFSDFSKIYIDKF